MFPKQALLPCVRVPQGLEKLGSDIRPNYPACTYLLVLYCCAYCYFIRQKK